MASRTNWITLVLAAVLLAACAPMPEKPAPQVTESMLREKAQQNFALGLREYEAGSYDDALKNLSTALDHGLLSKSEQSKARKYLAFIHCASNREAQCREEFRKAMEIDPGFDLTQAEAGHPIWGPIYRNVRSQLVAATTPPEKPRTGLSKGEQMLADGLAKYDAGDFDAALKLLQAARIEGVAAKGDQIKALKFSAFCLCLSGKYPACRAEFLKIFEIDATFDLTPAEAGHPSWTKTYAAAKQHAKEAREKAAKDAAAKKN